MKRACAMHFVNLIYDTSSKQITVNLSENPACKQTDVCLEVIARQKSDAEVSTLKGA